MRGIGQSLLWKSHFDNKGCTRRTKIAQHLPQWPDRYSHDFVHLTKCKCKFTDVKHRECLRNHPSQRLMIKCLTKIKIEKCWFLRRGENRRNRRKTSRRRVENQQQTQPTYDAGSGNRTRDTLVGGERSHFAS